MLKKTLILAVAALLSLPLWAGSFKVGDAKYKELGDGTLELEDYKKASGDIVIPEKVLNPKAKTEQTVTSIKYRAFYGSPITSIVIPESVIEIGTEAFAQCKSLSRAVLPKSLNEIPEGLFDGCTQLTECSIDDVEHIGQNAFREAAFSEISIPATVKTIESFAFQNCKNLNTVRFNDGDTELNIYSYAFDLCPVNDLYFGRKIKESRLVMNLNRRNTCIFGEKPSNLTDLTVNLNDEASIESIKKLNINYSNLKTYSNSNWPKSDSDLANYVNNKSDYSFPDDMLISIPKSAKFDNIIALTVSEAADWSGKEATDNAVWVKWSDLKEALDSYLEICEFASGIQNINETKHPEFVQALNTRFKAAETFVLDSVANELINKKPLTVNEIYALATPISLTYLYHLGSDYGIENPFVDILIGNDVMHKDLAENKHTHEYEMLIDIQRAVINNLPKPLEPANIADSYTAIMAGLCGLGRWSEAAKFYQAAHRAYTKSIGECPQFVLTLRDWIKAEGVKISDPVYTKAGKTSKNGFTSDDAGALMKAALGEYMDYRDRKKAKKLDADQLMKKMHFKDVKYK